MESADPLMWSADKVDLPSVDASMRLAGRVRWPQIEIF
jgi:hypothetical protein